MKLYVIRHGQTIVNIKELVNSWNQIGLNKVGKKEAYIASDKIKKLDIDLIICSPLRRTKQTCKIINKNMINVIFDRRIIERNSRSMQFKKITKIDREEWYDTNKMIVYKNSEGFKSILERVGKFINDIKEKYTDKTILIVTHGDVCKAIYSYLNNINDAKKISSFKQKNCEIVKYDIL